MIDIINDPFVVSRIHQVALVVRDLEAAMRAYWERLRIGPWAIYTFDATTVQEMTYRGQRQEHAMRIGFTRAGDVQVELIQSLRGPNIYEEHLAERGEGLHHLGVTVPDLGEAVQQMEARGYSVIQSGRGTGIRGDGGYAYLETRDWLAAYLELIEVPAERRPPEAVYPPAPG
jgi:methylmalonyl-CoA/ethylmalonyl-CoA epimerase